MVNRIARNSLLGGLIVSLLLLAVAARAMADQRTGLRILTEESPPLNFMRSVLGVKERVRGQALVLQCET
jgi:hypothetical protein